MLLGEGKVLAVVLGMAHFLSSQVKLSHILQGDCTRYKSLSAMFLAIVSLKI